MSLSNLQAIGRLQAQPPDPPAMAKMLQAARQNLADARVEQISASNTTTTRNRSAAQTASRPAEQKKRLSLTLPIQQHTGIYQYTTPYHSAEQRRARKGGARGGKAGFVTPSAFPPRKPAHAKVSPLERKRPPPGASVRRPTLYNIWYNFLIIFINNTITCIL
mgnify:CR=1 FL=1